MTSTDWSACTSDGDHYEEDLNGDDPGPIESFRLGDGRRLLGALRAQVYRFVPVQRVARRSSWPLVCEWGGGCVDVTRIRVGDGSVVEAADFLSFGARRRGQSARRRGEASGSIGERDWVCLESAPGNAVGEGACSVGEVMPDELGNRSGSDRGAARANEHKFAVWRQIISCRRDGPPSEREGEVMGRSLGSGPAEVDSEASSTQRLGVSGPGRCARGGAWNCMARWSRTIRAQEAAGPFRASGTWTTFVLWVRSRSGLGIQPAVWRRGRARLRATTCSNFGKLGPREIDQC